MPHRGGASAFAVFTCARRLLSSARASNYLLRPIPDYCAARICVDDAVCPRRPLKLLSFNAPSNSSREIVERMISQCANISDVLCTCTRARVLCVCVFFLSSPFFLFFTTRSRDLLTRGESSRERYFPSATTRTRPGNSRCLYRSGEMRVAPIDRPRDTSSRSHISFHRGCAVLSLTGSVHCRLR